MSSCLICVALQPFCLYIHFCGKRKNTKVDGVERYQNNGIFLFIKIKLLPIIFYLWFNFVNVRRISGDGIFDVIPIDESGHTYMNPMQSRLCACQL